MDAKIRGIGKPRNTNRYTQSGGLLVQPKTNIDTMKNASELAPAAKIKSIIPINTPFRSRFPVFEVTESNLTFYFKLLINSADLFNVSSESSLCGVCPVSGIINLYAGPGT